MHRHMNTETHREEMTHRPKLLPHSFVQVNPEFQPQQFTVEASKVGNPVASILKSTAQGVSALFGLNPVSNFMGFTNLPRGSYPTPFLGYLVLRLGSVI